MHRRIPAGLVDAGLASLATFVTGLYAVSAWARTPARLGFYALFMSAFGLATALTSQLASIPTEKAVLDAEPDVRLALLPATFRKNLAFGSTGAVVMIAPAVMALGQGAPGPLVGGLFFTAALTAVVSPLQDHVRRMLHLAEASWMAAATSLVQASGATVALIILGRAVGDPAWVAFGALGAANVVSVSFGLWIARRNAAGTKVPAEVHATVHHSLRYREVVRGGRYLALTGVMSAGTNLLVTWLVSTIAGASTVGYAEAARTIAQPVMVVAMGLRSVMGPASMDAGRRRDRQAGSRVAWTFYAALGALSLVYAVAVGPAWSFSPLPGLVSLAYVVGWTVAITILANVLNGAAFPRRLELVGAGRERSLLMSEAWANAAQLATAAVLATAFGGSVLVATLARPGSMVALGVTRIGLYRVPLDHHYDREPVPTT